MACDCSICKRPDNHAARLKIDPRTFLRYLVSADAHRMFHKKQQAGCVYCDRAVLLDDYGLPDCVSLLAYLKNKDNP